MDASTFPIPFWYHLILSLVATAFFVAQFIRVRKPYQLLLAVAMLSSMLIYASDINNKSWFHAVGVFELVLLLGAIVLSVMGRISDRKKAKSAEIDDSEKSDKTDSGDKA